MQILRSGPSEATLRQQAFNRDMNTAAQAGSQVFNSIQRAQDRTLRQKALEQNQGWLDFQRAQQLSNASGMNISPEQVQEIVKTGDFSTYAADGMGPPQPKGLERLTGQIQQRNEKRARRKEKVENLGIERAEAELGILKAKPEAERRQREQARTQKNYETIDKLRKEVSQNQATKNYQSAVVSTNKLFESVKNPSAAGDIAMVFNFMKVMDPGSVVREGEFATAASAAGLPDRIVQYAERVDNGMRLTNEQRRDLLNIAMKQAKSQEKVFLQTVEPIALAAGERNLDISRIVPEFTLPNMAELPKPGVPTQGLADVNTSMNQQYDPNGNPIDAVIPQANAIEQQQMSRIPQEAYQRAQNMSREEKLRFLGL